MKVSASIRKLQPAGNLPDKLFNRIVSNHDIVNIDAYTQLVSSGDTINKIPFLVEGRIRIFKEDEASGREVLIYHVLNGQTCMMSIIAALRGHPSKVDAMTCLDSKIIFVNANQLKELIYNDSDWKNYALDVFMNRYYELVESIESMTFDNVEKRIMKLLNKRCKHDNVTNIQITHQKIADLLGTTRVVVSRLLKKLENDGKIKLSRECITINKESL